MCQKQIIASARNGNRNNKFVYSKKWKNREGNLVVKSSSQKPVVEQLLGLEIETIFMNYNRNIFMFFTMDLSGTIFDFSYRVNSKQLGILKVPVDWIRTTYPCGWK